MRFVIFRICGRDQLFMWTPISHLSSVAISTTILQMYQRFQRIAGEGPEPIER
jgi:hypothetical protein